MPSVQERIFRSSALARHTSPEGLETLLEITTVRGWIALAGLGAVVVAAMIWGILGRVPQVVKGQGIMVTEGGVLRVQASGAGRIDSVLVDPGTRVRRGQVVAVLAQSELRTSIEQLRVSLDELRRNRASTAQLLESDRALQLTSIEQQQKQADEAIAVATQRIASLDARIANERRAVERGLLLSDVLQSTIAQRAETELERLSTLARKQQLSADVVQLEVSRTRSLFDLNREIAQASDRLERLEAQLASVATVTSPYDGTVVERLADGGQEIGVGATIITVEPTGVDVQVMMFIPLEGKRITPGMRVEMVPGGVRPEETGYFLGHVRAVSGAPLSGTALDRYLKNEVLVEQFTSEGGAYLVDVTVERDSTTISQYKWTSRAGAPLSFGSGTLVSGKIVVTEMRPIELIIPAIRRWLGG